MHEMMDFQLVKQRREELLREAERNRQAACGQPASGLLAGDQVSFGR